MGKNDSKEMGGNGQVFHFGGHIGQLNINVDNVNNYGDVGQGTAVPEKVPKKDLMDLRDLVPVRGEIIKCVSELVENVAPSWKSAYLRLWDGILNIPEVEAQIYDPGKQKDTDYNRNLLANIIHYLGSHALKGESVYMEYNATDLTTKLGYQKAHSIRAALGNDPSVEIKESLKNYIEEFKL